MSNSLIPFVENCYFISRQNNIIYANLTDGEKVPLVRLKQKFIDVMILEKQAFDYMERYMQMFPNHWEYLKKEKQQLKLF